MSHGGYILGSSHGGLLGEGQAFPLVVLLTLLFWTTCLVLHASATIYNLKLYSKILAYMFCSKDTKWPPNPDPGSIPEADGHVEERTVIFVRHGESTWNETFNPVGAKKLLFPFGVISALITESYLLLGGKRDSWFYDSSLNAVGQTQASDLRKFLATKSLAGMSEQGAEDIRLLQGVSSTPSVIVSSTLRRAVSTIAIALYDRLRRTVEKIVWLPACQEISRNPDTLCITPAGNVAKAAMFDQAAHAAIGVDLDDAYQTMMDMSLHTGNKPLDSNGGKRLHAFAQWAFDTGPRGFVPKMQAAQAARGAASTGGGACIIVGGHSLWFRSFFREFLPKSASDGYCKKAKERKLHNGGAVAFTLRSVQAPGRTERQCKIVPESVRPVYLGWS